MLGKAQVENQERQQIASRDLRPFDDGCAGRAQDREPAGAQAEVRGEPISGALPSGELEPAGHDRLRSHRPELRRD